MNSRRLVIGLFLLALAAAASPVAAQIRVGPMAGLSVANWHGKGVDEPSSIVRFTGGIFLTLRRSEIFSIEPQVLYVQKGSRINAGSGGSSTVKLDYVEVPLLFHAAVPTENSAVHPNFFAGPAFAFRVSCKVEGEGTAAGMSQRCDGSGAPVKSTDFALTFGLGFQVYRFDLQFRDDVGFSHIGQAPGPSDITNQAFLMTVGFGI